VVLGEMADAATIDTALKGAETGHLVIATITTPDVVTTIERVIATLPAEEREIGRMRFSEAVHSIVSQQLLPLKGDKGRVAAVEVMLATPAVRECLKDSKRTSLIKGLMEDGQKELGTQTYEQHLDELIGTDQITEDTKRAALATANQPLMVPKRSKQA